VLEIVSSGRISVGKAAELLKVSVYDIYKLAEKHGVKLGGTIAQRAKSEKTAKRFM